MVLLLCLTSSISSSSSESLLLFGLLFCSSKSNTSASAMASVRKCCFVRLFIYQYVLFDSLVSHAFCGAADDDVCSITSNTYRMRGVCKTDDIVRRYWSVVGAGKRGQNERQKKKKKKKRTENKNELVRHYYV